MGGEQAWVDTRVLSVGLRGDGGDPLAHTPCLRGRLLTGTEFLSTVRTARGYGRDVSPTRSAPLLDAAREGDDQAVAELVRRTQPDVWRLCVALGSTGEEQDLVQETYLRALRSLGSYRGDAPVRAWLLSIARNVCADHVRRARAPAAPASTGCGPTRWTP